MKNSVYFPLSFLLPFPSLPAPPPPSFSFLSSFLSSSLIGVNSQLGIWKAYSDAWSEVEIHTKES